MSYRGLDGAVVIVTGAGGGIGAATARRLADDGARVVVVDIDGDLARSVADALDGEALAVAADVSTESGVDRYMAAAVERFGRINGVHLNAGVTGVPTLLADSTLEDWSRVVAVNLTGNYLGMRAALRVMRDQGIGGSVVSTASTGGIDGAVAFGPYCATKHGVIGLVRTAALEGAPFGIRVNAICPAVTDTAMAAMLEELVSDDRATGRALIEAQVPLGRYARPDEIAAVAAWLLSDEPSFSTGAFHMVDGGQTAGAAWSGG
jgi:NAD(P)-dependent dehydrogenase (short-subunit alcohol dehydrogenase family)